MRGTLHLAAALLAPAGLVLLLLIADTPRSYVGGTIFAISVMLLYATSATYHLAPWRATARRIMMRVDHSMIFVLIAGTYTPFCLVVLNNAWGIPMLSIVWTLAGAGIILKVLWPTAPRKLSVALYLGLGWLGIIAAGPLTATMTGGALLMLLAGGMMYSIGAIVYARRSPNPLPRVYGYHEVFHTFVIAGSAIHFVLIAAYVL
jgi:hemolysin III